MKEPIIKAENIGLEFICGLILLIVLGLIGLLIRGFIKLAIHYPKYTLFGLVIAPLSLVTIWAIGHIAENYPNYGICSCGKRYRQILNGYFHKRKCLAHLVKNY
jgi:hypothetical protein